MACYTPETFDEELLKGALFVYRRLNGPRVVRCRICHLGFSGERDVERATIHLNTHPTWQVK
jgi:hypothetical protein